MSRPQQQPQQPQQQQQSDVPPFYLRPEQLQLLSYLQTHQRQLAPQQLQQLNQLQQQYRSVEIDHRVDIVIAFIVIAAVNHWHCYCTSFFLGGSQTFLPEHF